MSAVVLLLICLHNVATHPSENNISTENVSNKSSNELSWDQNQNDLVIDKNMTINKSSSNIIKEKLILNETTTNTIAKPHQNLINIEDNSHEKNNTESIPEYTELENSTEINIDPYTDKDGLIDVVADNGIKYESSASDNFVLPGHGDDSGNFAGITDDSEPMHYYISEEGDLSAVSDDVGIEVLLPDYVKPKRKSDDDDIVESGETTTVDEDLIIPDSVETTTMPTTEATTWFYHSWEFRGENFEIKDDVITTIKPVEQEYIDEDEQIPDLKSNMNITKNISEEIVTPSYKLVNQPIKEDKYEEETVIEDSDDVVDYKNLMADESDLEQTTTETIMKNKKNMERYTISFSNELPIQSNPSNSIPLKEQIYNEPSDKSVRRYRSTALTHTLKFRSDDPQLGENQPFPKRIKRENIELEPTFQEEGINSVQETVTESVLPETTRIWRWPTHSWENHGDMYEPTSTETETEISTKNYTRSGEEMEYSEDDISVGVSVTNNNISFSENSNQCDNDNNKPFQSVFVDSNKGENMISDSKKAHALTTEESQYDDVSPANVPGFEEGPMYNPINKKAHLFTQNNGSQELFTPTCLIEWETCKSDGDCCRPYFCSTLPKFPIIENMNASSTMEVGQFCSRFQSIILGDSKSENRTDLLRIIESYKRKILEVINL